MDKAKLKIVLPQEGTRKGESLPEHGSGCPTFSGGGKVLHDIIKTTTTASNRTDDTNDDTKLASQKRTVDMPSVRLERDAALDRFAVQHWAGGTASSAPAVVTLKRSHGDKAGVEVDNTPSKVATARRGKMRDLGSSTRVTHAAVACEPSGSHDHTLAERTCTDECVVADVACLDECPDADVGCLDGIEFLDPASLRALAKEKTEEILEVAKRSGNLKGTFVKILKEAAWTLQEVTATALTRTVAQETLVLRRETRKLRQEVDDLKAELTSLRSRGEVPPAPPLLREQPEHPGQGQDSLPQALVDALGVHMDRMERTLRVSLGEVVTARIEALDDRLLPAKVVRPPLASDKKKRPGPAASNPARPKNAGRKHPEPLGMEWVALPSANPDPVPAANPDPVSGPEGGEGWTTVARRRKRKKASAAAPLAVAAKAPFPRGKATGGKSKRKLPSKPRSAAVIVTLRPEAVERGVTYKSALMGVNRDALAELGIDNLSLRPAATGSRIIEIPGARGPEQAGGLAQKLSEALADVATVAIPVKRVNVRVVGLDETVTVADVVAVAAARGGCEPALIRAGEIRPYGRGSGAIHLSLPVVAAKALVEAGRLLVGWSAARVRLLEMGPLRCYRCLDVGHTRPVCQSAVDRGGLCFRCGQPGHKALQCAAVKLYCALCADAGRPSDHHMGGAKCRPPPKKWRAPPAPTPS